MTIDGQPEVTRAIPRTGDRELCILRGGSDTLLSTFKTSSRTAFAYKVTIDFFQRNKKTTKTTLTDNLKLNLNVIYILFKFKWLFR